MVACRPTRALACVCAATGLVHVVMFSSEVFFSVGVYSALLLPAMYAWLEADLAAVDRNVTPWVITMAHQPMYCSPNDDDDE